MFLINKIAARRRLMTALTNQEAEDEALANNVSPPTERRPFENNERSASSHSLNVAGASSGKTQRRTKTNRVTHIYRIETSMSELHVKALRVTWRRIRGETGKGAERIMSNVADKATTRNPVIRDIFMKSALASGLKNTQQQQQLARNAADQPGSSTGGPMSVTSCGMSSYRHSQAMVQFMDSIIANLELDNPNCSKQTAAGSKKVKNKKPSADDKKLQQQLELLITAADVGAKHVGLCKFGFKASMFEDFGQIMAEEMFMQEMAQAFPGGKRAWGTIIAQITDQIRHGFDKQRGIEQRQATMSRQNSQQSGGQP